MNTKIQTLIYRQIDILNPRLIDKYLLKQL